MSDVDLSIGPPGPQRVDNDALGAGVIGDVGAGDEVEAPGGEPPQVDEWMVRGLVRSLIGRVLKIVLGVPDCMCPVCQRARAVDLVGPHDAGDLWEFTDRELDELVPPLTRIINRRPALRAAVIRGDEATVGVVLASYLGRNFADRRRVRRVRDELTGQVQGGEGPAGQPAAGPAGGRLESDGVHGGGPAPAHGGGMAG